jgi:hypothetical protein
MEKYIQPNSITTDMVIRAMKTRDPYHIAGNLNAMLKYGYCEICGMVPQGCKREGCGSKEAQNDQ